jgi:glucitol/sorbitol PTS system EIIA component
MTVKYETITTSVGEMAAEFAAEGILVFFGPDAPEELHDFAILTEASGLASPIEPGDVVEIGGSAFPVVSVGSVANDNLAGLGHLVVKFNGLSEPELPGDVSLPAVPAPPIEVGTRIRITREG